MLAAADVLRKSLLESDILIPPDLSYGVILSLSKNPIYDLSQ